MEAEWRIRLFGGLRAEHAERVVTRFETEKTGALLAYLAYHLWHSHPRELLADLLWPQGEPNDTRHRLSKALSALRRDLEPATARAGAVFLADRLTVRLNPDAVTTDVAAFSADLQAAARAADPIERARWLAGAVGELPHPITRFVGREPEMARLRKLLLGSEAERGHRLEARSAIKRTPRLSRGMRRFDKQRQNGSAWPPRG
jgi:two-component SAPR family response regulator